MKRKKYYSILFSLKIVPLGCSSLVATSSSRVAFIRGAIFSACRIPLLHCTAESLKKIKCIQLREKRNYLVLFPFNLFRLTRASVVATPCFGVFIECINLSRWGTCNIQFFLDNTAICLKSPLILKGRVAQVLKLGAPMPLDYCSYCQKLFYA